MSKSAANLARNNATQDQNNATTLEGTLTPIFTAMAQGRPTPGSVAANTLAGQTVGGAQASNLGQGALRAARTRNAASFAPAGDAGAQGAARTLSDDALNITQQNQRAGLQGLQGLYGTNADNALKALGLYNDAADNSFWNQLGGATAGAFGKALGAGLGGLFGQIPGMGAAQGAKG